LLAALPKHAKPVALCLYETGMRPAEVFALRWEWIAEVCEDRWLIVIPPAMEKTGAERKVPVSQRLLDVLKPVRRDEGLVFPSPVTGAARLSISKAFTAAMVRAKLKRAGLSPYALRRTRITIWDEIDGNACSYAVGHTFSDVHSRHYRAFTAERLFKLVDLPFDHREQFKLVASAG